MTELKKTNRITKKDNTIATKQETNALFSSPIDDDKVIEQDSYVNEKSLRNYLNEIFAIPLLTEEEEKKLGWILLDTRTILEREQITDEKIDESLVKLGYSNNVKLVEKNLESRKNQQKWLENLDTEEAQILNKQLDVLIRYKEVLDEMEKRYLKLVVPIAKHYCEKINGMEYQDLIQEGSIGLRSAIEKFDIRKNNLFLTYANWWINHEITRAIANKNYLIRKPVDIYKYLSNYMSVSEKIEKETQTKPTIEEIVPYLKITQAAIKAREKKLKRKLTEEEISEKYRYIEKKVEEILTAFQEPLSLNYNINNEDDNSQSEFEDYISKEGQTLEEILMIKELENEISKLLREIPKKQAIIIALRYGLSLKKYFTYEDLILASSVENSNTKKVCETQISIKDKRKIIERAILILESYDIDVSLITKKYRFIKSSHLEEERKMLRELTPEEKKKSIQILLNLKKVYEEDCNKLMTFEEIGKIFGLPRNRIHAIENSGKKRLRSLSETRHLTDYLN